MASTFFSFISLLFFFFFFFFKKFNRKLNKNQPPTVPGALPFIGHLHLLSKPLHSSLHLLSTHHRADLLLLRFGSKPVLIVSSAAMTEECFSAKNDIAFANRPMLPFNRYTTYNFSSLIAAPYGSHWRTLRRIATVELLSSQRVNSLSGFRAAEARALAASIFNLARDRPAEFRKVELKLKLYELGLNALMAMVAGKSYYGSDAERSEEAREFKEIMEESLALTGTSNLGNFIPALRIVYHIKGITRRLKQVAARRDKFLQSLVDGLRGDESRRKTLIGVLLSLQEAEPEYYTDTNIKALILSLLTAGSDTASATMEWAMSLLLNHPEILRKAKDEIDERVGNSRLIEEFDLPNLPYLHSIISEALRLKPVAPLLVPHESSQDCVVGGFNIPRGTMLLINAYTIHRDPAMWNEPLKFKPERFANGGEGEIFMIPFGMGRRKCPGEGLGLKLVGLVLGTLIQCFEWERVSEEHVDMTESAGLTMAKVRHLEAMFRPRPEMVAVLSKN